MKFSIYLLSLWLIFISGCSGVIEDQEHTLGVTIKTTGPHYMPSEGGSAEVAFSAGGDWTAEVEGGGDWCTLSATSGQGGDNLKLRVTMLQNRDIAERSVGLKIRVGANNASLILIQPNASVLELLSSEIEMVAGQGGSVEFDIFANMEWSARVESGADWCTLQQSSGKPSELISLRADIARNFGDERTATVVVSCQGAEITVNIDQDHKIIYNFVIGDLYPVPGDLSLAKGVVFYVEDGGLSGKYLSFTEMETIDWGADGVIGIVDKDNGLNNIRPLKGVEGALEYLPAFKWVDELNGYPTDNIYSASARDVWYLPAINELYEVYLAKDAIYETFDAYGFDRFVESSPNVYWSSTEGTDMSAAVIHFDNGQSDYALRSPGYYRLVRAIARF